MFATQIRRLRDTTNLLHTFVNKEHARMAGDSPVEAKTADAENDGDPGSGDEGGKRKTPNLPVAQVAFAETGRQDQRRVRFIPHFHRLACFNLNPLVDKLSLRNSWNFPARNCGLASARSSKNPSVSGAPLYVFSFPNGQHYFTPSPQKKLNGGNALRAPTFQLVFSNAMGFDSEESQIHGDAQALKVCSF